MNYLNSAQKYILEYWFNKKDILLEPITTLIKLGLLNYYEDGAKMSISNNKITIQENNYLQTFYRISKGDSRENITSLYNSIALSLLLARENCDIKEIIKRSVSGLNKLKLVYNHINNNSIIYCIDQYISLLNNFIENDIIDDNIENSYDINYINKTKNIWSITDIKLINNYFKILDDCNNKNKVIDSIELYLDNKYNDFENILINSEKK